MQAISETKLISGVLSITVGFFLLIKTALIIRTPENNTETKIFFAVLGISLFILGKKWLKSALEVVVPVEKEQDVIVLSKANFPIQEDVSPGTIIHQIESNRLAEIAV